MRADRDSAVSFGVDTEAEYHPALVMLGNMAMRHPETGNCDIEEDVNDLAHGHEHRILPDEVRLRNAVAGQNREPSGPVT